MARNDTPRERTRRAAVPAFFLYGEPLRAPDEATVHVETIAARSALHGWEIRPHRHRDLQQLLLLQRGRVEAALDERTALLRAPAVLVVPAGSVHAFRFQEATVGLVVSFGSGFARDLGTAAPVIREFLERPRALALDAAQARATDLEALARMLLREFERAAPGRDSALRGLLGALLANLVRLSRTPADDRGTMRRDPELVARYRQLLESSYREHRSIASYARALGTSETRLRRACLAVAGQSPVQLMHARLLIEAERQLRYTSMSVAQVAYYLGFEDPAYFSRFFTRGAGSSPRRFRLRAR